LLSVVGARHPTTVREVVPVAGSEPPSGTDNAERGRARLGSGVRAVGLTSFFSDAGHEIATSLLPSFVTSVLHASAAALGLIEGFSDALTGVAKLLSGPLANDSNRRARLASGGYVGTAAATGAIGAASAVWQVGLLRAFAWTSRGVRSPSRDTILANLADPPTRGRAFGLERAGDNLGAVAGPLLAAWLVPLVGIRHAIYFSFVPGFLAAVAITFAARESRKHPHSGDSRFSFRWKELYGAGVVRPLLPIAMFEFGNVATTLLILRSTQILQGGGRSIAAATSLAVLIYAVHNAFASAVAYVGGHWIDLRGARPAFATGAVLYLAAYAGFAAGPRSWWELMIFFVLAGSGIGLAETAESTLLASLLPDRLRGSGFGVLGAVQAGGDLVSTVVVGVLYTTVSPAAGFTYAAAWMLLSALASGALASGATTGQ
jgi:MFS family permease